jgi:HEAT repeat protein
VNRLAHRRLVRKLFSRDETKRNRAATALIGAEDPRTTRRLERLLEGRGSDDGRAAAAHVLGFGGEAGVAKALVGRLGDPEESVTVRAHAAEALGHLLQHDPVLAEIRTTIGACLLDPEPEVRFWCAFAAGALNLQELRARLERLREDGAVVEGWWTVGEEASWALRCLDGEEDPPLARAL